MVGQEIVKLLYRDGSCKDFEIVIIRRYAQKLPNSNPGMVCLEIVTSNSSMMYVHIPKT